MLMTAIWGSYSTVAALNGGEWASVVIFFAGTLIVALGIGERMVRWRARDWPTAQATIHSASVTERSGKGHKWISRLDYSFAIVARRYTGRYSRTFNYEDDAREWIRNLEGRTVAVHYWPRWPALSVAGKGDIEVLLRSRLPAPPVPIQDEPEDGEISTIRMALTYLFMALAAIGFGLSLYVHLGSLIGRVLLPQSWFMAMHVGMFVPFLAVFLSSKNQRHRRKDADSVPGFLGTLMVALLVYVLGNFAWFMIYVATHRQTTPVIEWRGLSGHWMLFHFWAFVFLYLTARRRGSALRNGQSNVGSPSSS
jgi:hypothetical protein